jgi:hypothetical protein
MSITHPPASIRVACFAATAALSTQASLAVISIETVPVNTVYIPPVYSAYDPNKETILLSPGRYENGHSLAGVVDTDYRIGTYEVTNSQYSSFLNAVDPHGENLFNLYNPSMTSNGIGGITYNAGAAAGAKYSIKTGMGNKPVNYVSWMDAARFTNWMHNGSQTYSSTAGSFELDVGAYFLVFNITGIIERNPDAKWWLPSGGEWGKAAYYQPPSLGGPVGNGLWEYPTQSNFMDNNLSDPDSGHSANFHDGSLIPAPDFGAGGGGIVALDDSGIPINGYYLDPRGFSAGPTVLLTEVGDFENSSSYYGTYDQAGNVQEWTDTFNSSGVVQVLGGAFDTRPNNSSLTLNVYESYGGLLPLDTEEWNTGFRVATNVVPEPSSTICVLLGMCMLGVRRR